MSVSNKAAATRSCTPNLHVGVALEFGLTLLKPGKCWHNSTQLHAHSHGSARFGTYFLPVFPCFFLHNCRRKQHEMSQNGNVTTQVTANNIIIPYKYPEEWVRLQSADQNFARGRCGSFVDNSRFWWLPGEDAVIPTACFATEEAVNGGDEKGEVP
jgi:hypothetical protein